ncbi:MAG: hypothetical protein ACK4ZJ_16390, partial [Allorhizobium sp.]
MNNAAGLVEALKPPSASSPRCAWSLSNDAVIGSPINARSQINTTSQTNARSLNNACTPPGGPAHRPEDLHTA